MNHPHTRAALVFASLMLVVHATTAQPVGTGAFGQPVGTRSFDYERLNKTLLDREASQDLSPLQDLAISVSKLDFKAPLKAQREYYTGFRFLSGKEYQGATEHLARATSTYPDFVAAHLALGSAYLGLHQNEQARDEFAKALALDDHLPISYLSLACAELALQHYAAAEEAVEKASSLAPLDQQVLAALAYAQLLNHHGEAAIETAHRVHSRVHEGAAIVHYYAAAAWDAQHNLPEAQMELQEFLEEDPKSPVAEQARGILQRMNEDQEQKEYPWPLPPTAAVGSVSAEPSSRPTDDPSQVQTPVRSTREKQVAVGSKVNLSPNPGLRAQPAGWGDTGWIFRTNLDEVAVVFAATDHGKAVSDLTQAEVTISDNGYPPAVVTGFRSETQLPLRLGLVIDTSESIISRFSFEQAAAGDFVNKVVTGKGDLAFVVGFSNSVLLVQDFASNKNRISEGINKLAPAGGTALWDAVAFAAEKLAERPEEQPVAKVLVVISDGEDNSSRASLKHAIEAAENGDVMIYAVSTQEDLDPTTHALKDSAALGNRALRTLAESTGGKAFFPGSIRNMDRSLGELQEVIRSLYFVSYKPALFKRDGQYHTINMDVRKSGHKLRVYTRKGYYAK